MTKLKYGKKDGITGAKKGVKIWKAESKMTESEIDAMLDRIAQRRKDPFCFFAPGYFAKTEPYYGEELIG